MKGGAQINAIDEKGKLPLLHAAENGRVDVLRSIPLSRRLCTRSLFYCCTCLNLNSIATFRSLLEANTDLVDYPDLEGNTALHYCAKNGHWNCVKLLSGYSYNLSAKNAAHSTAADMARANGHMSIAQFLKG